MSDYTSDFGESSDEDNEEIVARVAAFWKPATRMRSRHRRSITLHITDNRRVSFPASTFDSARILRHYLVAGVDSMEWVSVKELLLIPKTIREVERCLLLFELGRAVLVPQIASRPTTLCLSLLRVSSLLSPCQAGKNAALCLLTRLVGRGHIGKASVAHVLTMLGGPMERMESWGPPGRNKRRPCKVRVSLGDTVKTLLPGSVENWRATSRATD